MYPSVRRLLQPHKGSSETLDQLYATVADGLGFNPTRVRLKRVAFLVGEVLPEASTPQGFV